jgi:hypothetical protein
MGGNTQNGCAASHSVEREDLRAYTRVNNLSLTQGSEKCLQVL